MMKLFVLLYLAFGVFNKQALAQQITGNWHGKVGTIFGIKLELKLVQRGDSLFGTSYYYNNKNNYYKYSVKGYFNQKTNAVVWWDDIPIETKGAKFKSFFKKGGITEADFNCPGGGVMMLDGKTRDVEADPSKGLKIHLDKTLNAVFEDEWNVVIDNWTTGGNDRVLIDSIRSIAFNKPEYEKSIPINEDLSKLYKVDTVQNTVTTSIELPIKPSETEQPKQPIEFLDIKKPNPIAETPIEKAPKVDLEKPIELTQKDSTIKPVLTIATPVEKPTPIVFENIEKPKKIIIEEPVYKKLIEEKFVERTKVILAELPVADSIILYFYDNAEVDGDSISLFLDDKLLMEHIRLSDQPYIVTLNKEQLENASTLTMVAENLGAIPPNTSYVKTIINGKKYDATLSSTEQTSAVIKLNKL